MASYGAGVYRYDGTNIIHCAVHDEGNDITLFSIYMDNHGRLWPGTHEPGAFIYTGTSFEQFRHWAQKRRTFRR